MIAAIVQARMDSTRLPGKTLMDICGRSMLWHVVNRAGQSETIDEIIVATSDGDSDNSIASFCKQEGIRCFRGSENDVLDRYYRAAVWLGADVVVRITSDCPLIDPTIVDRVITTFLDGRCDYASNAIECTFPDGLDTEVFSFEALETAWHEATLMSEREHVTSYMWKNGGLFDLCQVTYEKDLSGMRWTVDEPQDLEFVREIYKHLYEPGRLFFMEDVVRLLKRRPKLLRINQGFQRNEGYARSMRGDRKAWELPADAIFW